MVNNNIVICSSIFFFLVLLPHQYHCYGSYKDFAAFGKFMKRDQLLKGFHSDTAQNSEMETSSSGAVSVGRPDGLKESDKIDRLPGQPVGVDINQYSGYVTVNYKTGKTFFYYFVESWVDASSKPLVLWFNAGDVACSGLGMGAFTEIGPFRVNKDSKTLRVNQYAWNKEANILFVDLAVGIGFSYSNRSSDYKHYGDRIAVHDTYTFLQNWLQRFPEYKNRDVFFAGESNIITKLAQIILQKNKYSDHAEIKLKGITQGGWRFPDDGTFLHGLLDYAWSHALISDEIYHSIKSNCNFSSNFSSWSEKCKKYMEIWVNITAEINSYDIYAPFCNSSNIYELLSSCSPDYISDYIKNPQVQKAFHAINADNAPHPWKICSLSIYNHWSYDSTSNMVRIITQLTREGIQVWLWSGDLDSIYQPVTSVRYGINKMRLSVVTPWYPWFQSINEVGGYVVGYGNLTFVTLRGAGAFVSGSQPARRLTVFSSFVNGKLPPAKPNA